MKKFVKVIVILLVSFFSYQCKKPINSGNSNVCINGSCNREDTVFLIADGQTKVTFEFTTSLNAYKQNNVVLSVSGGSLAPFDFTNRTQLSNTLNLTCSSGKTGGYFFTGSTDGLVSFTSRINDEIIDRKIKLKKSYPDSLFLSSALYTYKKTDGVSLTARLTNLSSNYVSEGLPVYFSISSNPGNILLQIEPSAFSTINQGICTAVVSLSNLSQGTGTVEITARANDRKGNKIASKTSIKFE